MTFFSIRHAIEPGSLEAYRFQIINSLGAETTPRLTLPQFRTDLYYSYHQSQEHDIAALRHAIQDIIDQGSISVEQLSAIIDPMIARSDCVVLFISDPHSTSHVKDDDACMISFEGLGSEPFMEERRPFG